MATNLEIQTKTTTSVENPNKKLKIDVVAKDDKRAATTNASVSSINSFQFGNTCSAFFFIKKY